MRDSGGTALRGKGMTFNTALQDSSLWHRLKASLRGLRVGIEKILRRGSMNVEFVPLLLKHAPTQGITETGKFLDPTALMLIRAQ